MGGNALLNPHALLTLAGTQPGMCIAEYSAGSTGHLVFPAAKAIGKEGSVHHISILPSDVHMVSGHPAYEQHDHLTSIQGDYFRHHGVPLPDSSLDRIFFVNQLYTLKDVESFLAESKRLLAPGGELWVVDWRAGSTHPVAPSSEHRMDALDLERALAGFGASTKPHSIGEHHFAIRTQLT